jgi:hypothetical protein
MPVFVVCELGAPPQRVKIDSPPVRVGRDPENDIVIREDGVSRDHALFVMADRGTWVVSCVSDTNPIVVDGVLTTRGATVREGSQVLVGSRYMVIFSNTAAAAAEYLGSSAGYAQASCLKCQWAGIVGTYSVEPTCPRCGGSDFSGLNHFDSGHHAVAEIEDLGDTSTVVASASELAADFSRLLKAKRSALERVDGHKESGARLMLKETEPLVLAKSSPGAAALHGMLIVGSATISWNSSQFVIRSALTHPALKLNGKAIEGAPLKHGDLIEIGTNSFRFVVG